MLRERSVTGVWVGLIVALISISAFVRIPMYPLPLTMQMFVVFLIPLVFGARVSFYGVALYIVLGLVGLPIFSGGGGLGYVLKPSFGYLIGYLAAMIPAGLIAERINNFKGFFLAGLVSIIIIYFFGILGLYLNINYIQGKEILLSTAFKAGVISFIIPDLIKLAGAIVISPALSRIFKLAYKMSAGAELVKNHQ